MNSQVLLSTVNRWGLIAATLITVLAIFGDRFLYADSAFFFVKQLELGGYFLNDPARFFAQILSQTPLQLSLALGLENLTVLGKVYGSTLFLMPLLSLFLCQLLIKDQRILLLPMLSFFVATMPAYAFIVSEAHVMLAAFWVLVALLLKAESLSRAEMVLAALLAALAAYSYESALFLNPLLIAILMWRWAKLAGRFRSFWAVAMLSLLLLGILVAGNSILHPRDANNESQFLESVFVLLRSSHYVWLLVPVSVGSLVLALRGWVPTQTQMLSCMALGAVTVGLALSMWPQLSDIHLSYKARVLLLLIPVGLMLLAWLFHKFPGQLHWLPAAGTFLLAFTIACQVSMQLTASWQWRGYLQVFAGEVAIRRGDSVVEFQRSRLNEVQIGRQLVAPLNWDWTFPLLSILLAPEGRVNRLIYNPHASFQPYPPNQPPSLNERYGLDYNFSTGLLPSRRMYFASQQMEFFGWYGLEEKFRWSEGHQASIQFLMADADFAGRLKIKLGSYQKQRVRLELNGELLGEQLLDGPAQLDFAFDPQKLEPKGQNTLVFQLPDAQVPAGKDSRLLAVNFHWLELN
jgi:hypothetical protein